MPATHASGVDVYDLAIAWHRLMGWVQAHASYGRTFLVVVLLCILAALHTQSSASHLALTKADGLIDYQQHPELKSKPRVVLGYVSDREWAFVEFLCMLHTSWRLLASLPSPYKLDLWVFTHPRYMQQVASLCRHLKPADQDLADKLDMEQSQCFAIEAHPPDPAVWHGYPFINNVHFMKDQDVVQQLTQHYGLAMKTDFDTFLSPAVLQYWPDRFTFGVQEYVIVKDTADKLAEVVQKLGLAPPSMHNLGPTWYGEVGALLQLGAASIPIMHHIITKEFEQRPEGGIKQNYMAGEGWPSWSAGIAALYATELAANHILPSFTATNKMDAHGGSEGLVAAVYHIHCRHGDSYFSKFEFFKHHYDSVDVNKLNQAIINDYCTYLATSTWRQLMQLQHEQLQRMQQQQLGHAATGGATHDTILSHQRTKSEL